MAFRRSAWDVLGWHVTQGVECDRSASGRRGSLRGRKVQIQVSRAVELEGCCAVDLAHGNAQVPLVGVDAVQAVVRGDDGYGGEGRTVLEDNGKGLWLGLEVVESAEGEEAAPAAGHL